MKSKREVILLLLAMFALGACQKKDIYDPNYNPELGVSVPEDFDWSTTKTLTVNVEVNDEYNGKRLYFVRLYLKNPKDGGLPIVNEKANMDILFSEKIVIPASTNKLYIEQSFINANAVETVILKEVSITGEIVDYSFKVSEKSAAKVQISSRDDDDYDYKLKVKEGETYTVDKATLKNYEIEVKKGATLHFTKSITLSDCKIENEGAIIVAQNMILKKAVLDNDYSLHVVGDLEIDNDSQLEMDDSSCTIVEGTASLKSDEKIEMEEMAFFSCGNLKLLTKGVTISMETASWLRVTGHLRASDSCVIEYDKDDDDDYIMGTKWGALVQIGEIQNWGKHNLKVDKAILVECKSPGKADIDSGSLVDDATEHITLVGTTCNDSGMGADSFSYLGEDYTFAMEDQYPNKGDYDMNDIVVLISEKTSYNSSKHCATITGQLIAAGANLSIVPYVGIKNARQKSKPLFTDPAGNIMNVYQAFEGKGATRPVNTQAEDGEKLEFATFTVELEDINERLNIDNIDFYIRVNNHEIDCNTKNEDNDIFGLLIPGKFKYPIEGYNIAGCYGEPFRRWIESGRKENLDWYKTSAKDVISF